jgi:Tol biopolymer transport system component
MIAVSLALTGIFGCAPSINYAVKSTPEESALQLIQITSDQDSVAGPTVYWKGKSWSYDVRDRISVSSDGSKIVFMSRRNGSVGITAKMLDGSNISFRKPVEGEAIDPCLSPDGSRMAFARCGHAAWNIYETTLDSNPAVRRLTSDPCYNVYPRYASDRTMLFNHVELQPGKEKGSAVPTAGLWSADLQTSQITEYGDGYFTPSCVPGKNKAVVVRLNDSTRSTELWTIDLSTGALSLLFGKSGRGAADPAVSPDGKVVAFVSMTEAENTPANLDIYTINIDGSNLVRRTFFPGQDICPRWSGNGGSLYFLSQRNTDAGGWNVWKMELSGDSGASAPADAKPHAVPADSAKQVLKAPAPQAAANPAVQKNIVAADSSKHDTLGVAKPAAPSPTPDAAPQGGK